MVYIEYMNVIKTKVKKPSEETLDSKLRFRVKGITIEAKSMDEAIKTVQKSNPELFAENDDTDDKENN